MQLLWFGERNKYADGDSLCAASGHQIQFHLAQRGGSSATFLGVRPSVNGRDSTPGPSRHPASNQLSHCCPALVTARFSSTALHKSFPKFSKIFSNFFPKFFQNFPIFFQIFPNFFPNFFPISFQIFSKIFQILRNFFQIFSKSFPKFSKFFPNFFQIFFQIFSKIFQIFPKFFQIFSKI